MMKGFLNVSTDPWNATSITLSGLDPGTIYEILVYSCGEFVPMEYGVFQVFPSSFTPQVSLSATRPFDETGFYRSHVDYGEDAMGNYGILKVYGASSYTIVAQTPFSFVNAAINGLQIRPEPMPWAPSVLSVNFVGSRGYVMQPLGNRESAGVVKVANWENALSHSGDLAPLTNSDNGYRTPVGIQYSALNGGTSDSGLPGDFRMMDGMLANGGNDPIFVYIWGLNPVETYNLFVYSFGYPWPYFGGMYTVTPLDMSSQQTIYMEQDFAFDGAFRQASGTFDTDPLRIGNFAVFELHGHELYELQASPIFEGQFTAVNALQIAPRWTTVQGRVELQALVSYALPWPLTFTFRPLDGGAPIVRSVGVGPDGFYRLYSVPPGVYTLHVKGARYLGANVPVSTMTGDIEIPDVLFLRTGDADDNNIVDVDDLSLFIQAFDAVPGDANWNPNTDFDGNGVVDVDDLHLFIINFDSEGDA
jgi:hypothetical protein